MTLLALNSKFIHSSLALWYLKAACKDIANVTSLECTINEPILDILHSIYDTAPDVLCISCYIWNIECVLKLCRQIKKLIPHIKILLGGPEVSFHATELMEAHTEIDIILLGEGEASLPAVLQNLHAPHSIPGTVCRINDSIVQNGGYQYIADLSTIPSPYTDEMLASLHGKLAYFESSRGCPFSCAYCLSCITKGVRTFPMLRVKEELDKLATADIQTIKFVDRTFNADLKRAKEIVRYILSSDNQITYHFEVAADLFDDELLSLLRMAPLGKIQIEAGIQSTNEETLAAVSRKTDIKKALTVLNEIKSYGNIHIHSDLIAGLPYETLEVFHNSFDTLYQTQPHDLQLGFLKLLYGSPLRANAEEFDYVFSDNAPYTFYANQFLTVPDTLLLHEIEDVLEKFYNSGRFSTTLKYLNTVYSSPFSFYQSLSSYLKEQVGRYTHLSPERLYHILQNYCLMQPLLDHNRIRAALTFDYYCSNTSRNLPSFLLDVYDSLDCLSRINVPEFVNISLKELAKRILVKTFPYDMQDPYLIEDETTFVIYRTQKRSIDDRFKYKKLELLKNID